MVRKWKFFTCLWKNYWKNSSLKNKGQRMVDHAAIWMDIYLSIAIITCWVFKRKSLLTFLTAWQSPWNNKRLVPNMSLFVLVLFGINCNTVNRLRLQSSSTLASVNRPFIILQAITEKLRPHTQNLISLTTQTSQQKFSIVTKCEALKTNQWHGDYARNCWTTEYFN